MLVTYSGFGVPLEKGAIMENMEQNQEKIAQMRMKVVEHRSEEFQDLAVTELSPTLREIWGGDFELVVNPDNLETPFTCLNFVVSREGIFNLKDSPGGGPISQGNHADAFGMAILRAQADAVMVGAGTVNGEPNHIWNTDFIFNRFPQMQGLEDLRREFERFREMQGKKAKNPPTIFMTNSGDINFNAVVFSPDSGVETYVVTGERGKKRIGETNPSYANVLVFGADTLDEVAMMKHLKKEMGIRFLLHEGGRGVAGELVAKGLITQLQLTRMGKSPKGNLDEQNAQYLFNTQNRDVPESAKLLSSRADAAGGATIRTFDFREVRAM